MSPTLDGICTVSQNVPSGLTVSITHAGVTTPELGTFGAETHSSHPCPWPHSGIVVSSSSDKQRVLMHGHQR